VQLQTVTHVSPLGCRTLVDLLEYRAMLSPHSNGSVERNLVVSCSQFRLCRIINIAFTDILCPIHTA